MAAHCSTDKLWQSDKCGPDRTLCAKSQNFLRSRKGSQIWDVLHASFMSQVERDLTQAVCCSDKHVVSTLPQIQMLCCIRRIYVMDAVLAEC